MRTNVTFDRIRRFVGGNPLAWLLIASESTFLTADTITLAISLLDFPPRLHWKKFSVVLERCMDFGATLARGYREL